MRSFINARSQVKDFCVAAKGHKALQQEMSEVLSVHHNRQLSEAVNSYM